MLQEHLRQTILFAVSLAFFLAIWQLIKACLASHFLQSVHGVGCRSESSVWSECVDVHFELDMADDRDGKEATGTRAPRALGH